MTIYHLGKIGRALAEKLNPNATLIRANPRTDTAESVLAAVPKGETEFLYHFNATYTIRWPAFRGKLTAALRKRGIRVINHHACDISRTTLQRALAAAGLPALTAKKSGSPNETLLVRPNFNYSGFAEAVFHKKYPEFFPRFPKTVTKFQIMPRRDVPAHLWNDPDVQIEKFISNPEDKIYRMTMWKDRILLAKYINPEPIKKGGGTTCWRCPGTTKNAEMIRVREYGKKVFKAMKYQFGAIDIVVDAKGTFYACDMNSTPWYHTSWRDFIPLPGETFRSPLCYLRDGTG